VEYQLTPLGRSLVEQFTQFLEWTLQAVPQIERAREALDRSAPGPLPLRLSPPEVHTRGFIEVFVTVE
jgi:hypothetical protein